MGVKDTAKDVQEKAGGIVGAAQSKVAETTEYLTEGTKSNAEYLTEGTKSNAEYLVKGTVSNVGGLASKAGELLDQGGSKLEPTTTDTKDIDATEKKSPGIVDSALGMVSGAAHKTGDMLQQTGTKLEGEAEKIKFTSEEKET